MLVPFTLVDAAGARRDVQAAIDGPAVLGEVLVAAGIGGDVENSPVWIDGRSAHAHDPADLAGLRPGSVVSLMPGVGAAWAAGDDPAAGLHLAVVAGPCSGTCAALRPGPVLVGRASDCDIRLTDPSVSNRHFQVETDYAGRVRVVDLGSTHGVVLGGEALTGPADWPLGAVLVAGDSMVQLRPGSPADAVVHPVGLAGELRRPPRIAPGSTEAPVGWPEPPATRPGPVVPLASAVLPLVLGVVMFAVTRQVLMLLFLAMTPLLVGANVVTTKRSGRKEAREKARAYADDKARADAELARAQAEERAARDEEHPDPARLLAMVTGPRRRLWERRPDAPDFLDVRLGTADLPSRVRLVGSDPYAKEPPVAPPVADVPCTTSLRDIGVLGVSGPDAVSSASAMWMVAQQAVLTGPADLRIAVLSDPRTGNDRWAWARWLPHVSVAPAGGSGDLADRVRVLADLVESRWRAREQHRLGPGSGGADPGWPWVLAVLDPAHDVRRIPGVEQVLQRGPAVQVVAICVEESQSYLPLECRAVVAEEQSGSGRLEVSGASPVEPIILDRVRPDWCELVARRLCALRDPEVRSAAGQLPAAARLVEVLGLAGAPPERLAARWAESARTTSAVLGIAADGPFSLDLRTDGPHGLVAGTTGAGKSELLQTLVASLAVANRPDGINFLLVDYKGGSAFRDCARLPHTVGLVTDLDGHLVERALLSLTAELKRREELLAEAAAKDIDDYLAAGEPAGPMPRLLIVIDEFAGLVAELPDFVTGLVGIAQRGRSLGIHLILATQRPSGVVSPEIRANTNLRVALRVVSPAESVDIIDAPDAARISPSTPGRAFALTGHSKLVPFQAARVGGPAAGADRGAPSVAVTPFTWGTIGQVAARPPAGSTPPAAVDPASTDLAQLVDGLIGAAGLAAVPEQRRPWLPPLPDVLLLDELDQLDGAVGGGPADPAAPGVRASAAGLIDLPAQQRQERWTYDPTQPRHLIVAGTPGSGRTTALRALAVALCSQNHPGNVWLYAVDCGGGELRRLADLPHCGAVVTRTETDRADRLLTRLRGEMRRRLDVLAGLGYADLGEYRAARGADAGLPYVVVMIDRWDGFMAAFDPIDTGRLTEAVLDLAREGGSVGIRLVVTGDRQILLGKLAGMIEDRLCLNLADPADYSMAGLDPRRVPASMPPGRAVITGVQAELQVAVPGRSPSGAAQTAAVAELAARWRGEGGVGPRPFRIDPLPERIDLADAEALDGAGRRGPHWALIGVGGDELGALGVDLLEAGGFVVAGPRRSGRSTALAVMARSLLAGGCPVLAFCPRPSPLRRLAGAEGVVGVVTGDSPSVPETLERVNAVEGRLAVLIDDAALLHQSDVAELLEAIARDGAEQGHVTVIAGGPEDLSRPMRGFVYEVRQSRTGLLLCPETHLQGEVIGARLPRSAVWSRPPGRGVLVTADGLTTVQVPWSE